MEGVFDDNFANKVAQLTYEKFKKLPKKGKPQDKKEWTSLASIVMSVDSNNSEAPSLKIVALCTGTKCLGRSFMSKNGDIINDSHAEVLTRRAFIRYLLYKMSLVLNGEKCEMLELHQSGVFILKPSVKFHFFISHTPCGDASIIPKKENINTVTKRILEESEEEHLAKKIKQDSESLEVTEEDSTLDQKSQCTSTSLVHSIDINDVEPIVSGSSCSSISDVFRTGAKCVETGMQDPKGPGKYYHITGALRTKPGRGDPTCSMSCSDKIALWNVCGIQGALASHLLLKPIYFSTIIIGKCPFNKSALQRAIINRTVNIGSLPNGYYQSIPQILQSDLLFEYSKESVHHENKKIAPCPAAIIWNDITSENVDVCVNGKRQGITKKNRDKPSSWVSVCRIKIFEEFLNVLKKIPKGSLPETLRGFTGGKVSYLECKRAALPYQETKFSVFKLFTGWLRKPDTLQMFVVHSK